MKSKKISDLLNMQYQYRFLIIASVIGIFIGIIVYILFDIQQDKEIDVAQIASVVIALTAISNNRFIERLFFEEQNLQDKDFYKRSLVIANI